MIPRIQGFIKYRHLLLEFVIRDIKTRYRRSVLGLLWTLLNPLLTMLVMTFVFSRVFRSDIEHFPVYLLSGLTIYNFFSESTNNAMMSIIGGSSLIKKIYIPKYLFPLSKVISTLVNLTASFLALLFVMLITGVQITPYALLLIIPMLYIFLFALGLGLFLSPLAVFFRDIIHFYSVLLMMWMYLTPLFYPLSILPGMAQKLIRLNPLTNIVECVRLLTLNGTMPPLWLHLACLFPGIVVCTFGLIVFYRTQDKFILFI
jgi:ABC-2 type transport system permease protein